MVLLNYLKIIVLKNYWNFADIILSSFYLINSHVLNNKSDMKIDSYISRFRNMAKMFI